MRQSINGCVCPILWTRLTTAIALRADGFLANEPYICDASHIILRRWCGASGEIAGREWACDSETSGCACLQKYSVLLKVINEPLADQAAKIPGVAQAGPDFGPPSIFHGFTCDACVAPIVAAVPAVQLPLVVPVGPPAALVPNPRK